MSNREVGSALLPLLVLASLAVVATRLGGAGTTTRAVLEVTGLILFARCFGGLHGTSLSPGGGAHGTSFLTLGPSSTFLDTSGLEAATGEGRGCSVSTGFGESLFLGGRPRPRLGGVAAGGSAGDGLVVVVREAELTLTESRSEASESELRLNF